jgi:nickel-dependent lactate racemase
MAQMAQAVAAPGQSLTGDQISTVVRDALGDGVAGERVLVLVPDRTRKVPMSEVFPAVAKALSRAQRLDVMVALGTHVALPLDDIAEMIGARTAAGAPLGEISNHQWADPASLAPIGTIGADRLAEIAGARWSPTLGGDLVIRVNKAALRVDRVVVVGPVLPHEVAGFSGGAKYLFPGIAGPEMIDVMHWLGALAGIPATIGHQRTPVRALIEEATELVPVPIEVVALVTDGTVGHDGVAGVYAGGWRQAWEAAVPQSDRLHTIYLDRAYPRVVSCAMPIYDELWTAGKAMYKLEQVVADGGELVIYAPHLAAVSATHGQDIFRVGYHVLDYFLEQWPLFAATSRAVLAHSSHVKGAGTYDRATGAEHPRMQVTLASAISAEDCRRLNLGYREPSLVSLAADDESTLVVPEAGEVLYRAR